MKKVKKYIQYLLMLIVIIFLSAISLNSSPLYDGMQHNDSSVFQVMGQGILNNQVIYKDLFDHKGPIVYIINAIGILINKGIGLFLIEIIIFFIGTSYIYKTAKVFLGNKLSFLVSIIYLMLSYFYLFGGNYTEEYSINIMAIALFYIMKILYKNEVNKKNWIIIGLTFALNFFIKPTYISIWIVFGIMEFICLVKEKKIKDLIKYIGYIFIGVMVVAIPLIIYLLVNNNFRDFVDAFFLMNIKYSNAGIDKKINAFIMLIKRYNYTAFIITGAMSNIFIVSSKKINKKIKIFITSFFIISIILMSWAPNTYHHYLIQLAPSITLQIIVLLVIISDIIKKEQIKKVIQQLPKKFLYIIILLTIIGVTAITASRNGGIYLKELESQKQQKQYLDEIRKYLGKDDELLVLGNEPYYNLYLGKQPKCKYFFQIPIVYYEPEIAIETYEYIKNKNPKVIINKIEKAYLKYLLKDNIKKELDKNYTKYNEKIEYYVLKEK